MSTDAAGLAILPASIRTRPDESGRWCQVDEQDQISGPVAEFSARLLDLQILAGQPSVTRLSQLTGIPRSTIQDKLSGKTAPTEEQTLAIVRACCEHARTPLPHVQVDEDQWLNLWRAMQRARREPRSQLYSASRARTILAATDALHGRELLADVGEAETPPRLDTSPATIRTSLIYDLRHFETDSREPYYIGRTLISIASFLDDYEIADDQIRALVEELIEELDATERKNDGLATPTIAISKRKIAALIAKLRELSNG
jgi:hypothetical protein